MDDPKYEITYDGDYPNTCRGTLTIKRDGVVIYEQKYCCSSTGRVWFDKDWSEHVEPGTLYWNEDEAKQFPDDIQAAVAWVLSQHHVCCGGCV